MTDPELLALCARAMGWTTDDSACVGDGRDYLIKDAGGHAIYGIGFAWSKEYNPLRNKAQALELVERLNLHIDQRPHPKRQITVQDPAFTILIERRNDDLA